MTFSYGNGEYIEGKKRIAGQIILGEHKLYLKGPEGDLSLTYIPLEKVERVKNVQGGLEVHVHTSSMVRYTAFIRGEKKHIQNLTADLVKRRGLKKKILKKEWFDESF